MVRCGSKNEDYKDMCLEEIGLHAQNMIIHSKTLKFNSQHNWGYLCDHLMSMIIFTLIMNIRYSYELQVK